MTLKDIAQEAGVSTATVSNVINGNHAKVSAANIERIQALVQKYNYVPNASARNLAAKSTNMIGVIVPEALYDKGNPHNALLVNCLEKAIKKYGYYLLLRCSDSMESAVATLTKWDVDGAIILGYLDREMAAVLKGSRRGFAVMLVDSYLTEEYPKCMCVRLNDYRGGYIAGRYLASCGHRNVVFVGTSHRASGVILQRFCGFRDALLEQRISLTENEILDYDTTFEDGILAGKEICNMNFGRGQAGQARITAVFAASDIAAVGIMEGVKLCGMSVPKDISVIGFDNANFCQFTTPKLTTVGQDVDYKAQLAAALLIDAIRGEEAAPLLTVIEPEIIERQSVWRM